MTLNGETLTGKSVKVKTSNNDKVATMELINILPDEPSYTITNVTLIPAEGFATFSGEATTAKSIISYSGSISGSFDSKGVLTIDLKTIK